MLSVIAQQQIFGQMLEQDTFIQEVYATKDFDIGQDFPVFYVLHKGGDVANMLRKFRKIYPKIHRFYVSENPMDSMFQNTKLIWRHGKWYL